jgi:prefoldin subunit 5
VTEEAEAEALRQQAAALQRSLDAINQRLANLTSEK